MGPMALACASISMLRQINRRLGNGNDLYLLSELRAVHHPSYHMLLRRYGMAASSPHQPLVHHCRELPVGDLRLSVPDSCRLAPARSECSTIAPRPSPRRPFHPPL